MLLRPRLRLLLMRHRQWWQLQQPQRLLQLRILQSIPLMKIDLLLHWTRQPQPRLRLLVRHRLRRLRLLQLQQLLHVVIHQQQKWLKLLQLLLRERKTPQLLLMKRL